MFLDILTRKLSQEGYEITASHGLADALRIVYDLRPNLVLLDIAEDGPTLVEEMQRDPSLKTIPVVAIADSLNAASERTIDLGARALFIKTELKPHQLVEKIIEIIGR